MSNPPSPDLWDSSASGPERLDPYLRMHSVTVYVRDQDRSLGFYLDQLGFTLVADVRFQAGRRWVAVAPPDGTAILTLVAPEPDSREYKLIGRPTQVVFVTEDVLAKFQEWRKRGVRFTATPRLRRITYERPQATKAGGNPPTTRAPAPVWGGVFTRFLDVDGNSFALAGFDELTREVEAQRRAAAEKVEAERLAAQELEIAKRVQAGLFPQTLPLMRTLEYAGTCIQARQVGGDYYDFLDLGQDRLGLLIGDISGKGIAAAILMANLQANLRSQCAIALDQPERLLRSVNQLFYENTSESAYATLFFAEYDDRTRRLRYVNCGHLCALLLRSDGALEKLESTTTVLGLFKDWDCTVGERRLAAGDTLTFYTDGITESFSAAGDEFGERRLIDVVRRHREERVEALMNSIVCEVRQFSPHQHDDVTLIIARCKEAEGTPLQLRLNS
ncbi:MAG TPA: SpoIIE family protein phosphatase [Terriglobia bacterium]|nr:SpoIIE family protein phosphatase [Terriglobia bacterium]